MTDEQIDAVFEAMPDGSKGWLKSWGYRQFARALLEASGHDKEVERLREVLDVSLRPRAPMTQGWMNLSACGCCSSGTYGGAEYSHKCEAHRLLDA